MQKSRETAEQRALLQTLENIDPQIRAKYQFNLDRNNALEAQANEIYRNGLRLTDDYWRSRMFILAGFCFFLMIFFIPYLYLPTTAFVFATVIPILAVSALVSCCCGLIVFSPVGN